MSVTGVAGAEREGKLQQVERLIASDVLHGSESLCKLLRYLAEQSIDHPGAGIKEYQIATEVFKRPPDFDPRMDSTVRVQTGRLRSKLAEYYAHAGADDQWIIEIPKGSYALTFHLRPAGVAAAVDAVVHVPADESPVQASPPRTSYKPWLYAVITLSGLLVVCLAAVVVLFFNRVNGRPVTQQQQPRGSLAAFWSDFVDTPDEPLVVFSNAEFVGRPETGMRYFDAKTDKPQPIMDHYTGVGEVLGMHELDRVFTLLKHELRVKRGRLLSMDDAKNTDLIFVGSPSENLSLREMPNKDFVFTRLREGPRKGDLALMNLHPARGEQTVFLSSVQLPLTEDYAVVALMPGLNPARSVLVLAGLTTLGTQAAAEFVSRPNTVEELLKRINGSATGKVAPFEAVLRVKVSGGVPVHSEVVAFHVRK